MERQEVFTPLPRVISRVVDRSARPPQILQREPREISLDVELSFGREGIVHVGREPADLGVSRAAVTVVPAADGWRITCGNRNGVAVHPWAQASSWLPHSANRTIWWPRVGLRVIGNVRHLDHWILLEYDGYPVVPQAESVPDGPDDTYVAARPRKLTPSQLTAVYGLFGDHLAWPPLARPTARSLEAVAHRVGVTPSAIRERLKPVQDRAREMGLHEMFGVTEPDYVFRLAAYGYLEDVPPSAALGSPSAHDEHA